MAKLVEFEPSLDWDSKIFNKKIGLLRILNDIYVNNDFSEVISNLCNDYGLDCLYIKCGSHLLPILKAYTNENFFFAGHNVFFLWKPDYGFSNRFPTQPHSIVAIHKSDKENLATFFDGMFLASRYYLDPKITRTEADNIYRNWIKDLIENPNSNIWVIRNKGDIVACITLTLERTRSISAAKDIDRVARIDLLGVDLSFRGKGIGRQLIKHTQEYCIQNEIQEIEVVTQLINNEASYLYTSGCFVLYKSELNLHYWH